jgi:CHAT domain-containing protein
MNVSNAVLTLLLSLTLPAVGSDMQDWQLLMTEADSLAAAGNDSAAAMVCDSARQAAVVSSNAGDTITAYLAERAADFWYDAAALDTAFKLYGIALSQRQRLLGESHPSVGRLLHRQARIHLRERRLYEAESLLFRAVVLLDVPDTTWRFTLAECLYSLGLRYDAGGRYSEAVPPLERARQILVEASKKHTDTYMATCSALGGAFLYDGNYARAEFYLNRELEQAALTPPEELSIHAGALHRLGVVKDRLADYQAAIDFFRQAHAMQTAAEAPNLNAIAAEERSLGLANWRLGKLDEAESWLRRAISTYTEFQGPGGYLTANCLRDIARVAVDREDFRHADVLFDSALAIQEETLGADHPAVAQTLEPQAMFFLERGLVDRAEPIFERVLRMEKGYWGPRHLNVASTLQALAECKRHQGDFLQALAHYRESFDIRYEHLTRNACTLSESDALRLSRFLRSSADGYLTCLIDAGLDNDSLIAVSQPVLLAAKGQISDQIFQRSRALNLSADSTTVALLGQYKEAVAGLSEACLNHARRGNGAEVDSLDQFVKTLERRLSRSHTAFAYLTTMADLASVNLSSRVPAGSCLIEYTRFDRDLSSSDSIESGYLAVVYRKQGRTLLFNLGRAREIDSLVAAYQSNIVSSASFWPNLSSQQTESAREIGSCLYSKLWKPLAGAVEDVDLVLIAPDAALCLLSFATLVSEEGNYLIERHALHYLSAARDLLRHSEPSSCGTGMLAIGDPDFDARAQDRLDRQVTPAVAKANELRGGNVPTALIGSSERRSVEPLPYTGREVRSVIRKWQANFGTTTVLLTGAAASEENFKTLAPGRALIHLATHGFFSLGDTARALPQARSGSYSVGSGLQSPLLRSGLLFAGANDLDSGYTSQVEDGILTAYEIASLNLEGTCWVVLSACQTALGELQAGEGVYGLHRAFQVAGARTVIGTLWPISDKETVSLMGRLYSARAATLPEALQQAAIERLSELRASGMPDHPYAWAAFVASGDWQAGPGAFSKLNRDQE